MIAFFLAIPIILIRFGLLAIVNKEALPRADYFAPLEGKERTAFWVYQITNILIFVTLFFLTIEVHSIRFYFGLFLYMLGMLYYAIAVYHFAFPNGNGLNVKGVYRVSRNPMYVAYFLYFLGCVLLTGSWVLLALLILFQGSVHFIIRSEERWCIHKFGEEYLAYMKRVRRYL